MINTKADKQITSREFLIYYDEDDVKQSGYFEVLKISDGFIQILTRENIVLIPMMRVLKLKIKQRGEEN